MRKVFAVLSGIVGVLLVIVGVAAAVVIGPDDTASLPTREVDTGDAQVAYTTPGLFAYTDATLHVTAENADGPVFVGAAHAVDVASYLTDVRRFQLNEFSLDGLTGKAVDGALAAPEVAPDKATFWRTESDGEGEQALDVELDGSPIVVAVVPSGEPGALTMSVGLVLPGAFLVAVATAVLGLILIVVPMVLRRRRARSGSKDHVLAAQEPTTEDSGSAAAAGREAGAAATTERRRVPTVVPVLAVVATVLAGCAGIPAKSPQSAGPPTKIALTQAEAKAALADYDARNNAAIALSASKYDPSGWEKADQGILLREDLYATQYAKANQEKRTGDPRTNTAEVVYAPAFEGYPMYAIVAGRATGGQSDDDESADDESDLDVSVFERASAVSPWKQSVTASVPEDLLPDAQAPGPQSTPTEADGKAALALLPALVTFLETGKATAGLTPTKAMTSLRSNVIKKRTGIDSAEITADPASSAENQLGAGGSVQAVRTADGLIATYALTFTTVQRTLPNFSLTRDDAKEAKALGQTGPTRILVGRAVAAVVISIPDDGEPTVLAFRDRRVLT